MADDYLLQEVIGQGGMGCVYRGLSPDGQEVAIKKLDCKYVSIPDFKEFFFIEANALKTMNHPSVVKFKGNPFADEKGNLYLPMEYVKGKTIEKVVNEKGPYTESEARSIMCKILDAFSYIHSHSMIHRDIKPSNIIIKPDGDICIIDFGIAKDMKISTGKTGSASRFPDCLSFCTSGSLRFCCRFGLSDHTRKIRNRYRRCH